MTARLGSWGLAGLLVFLGGVLIFELSERADRAVANRPADPRPAALVVRTASQVTASFAPDEANEALVSGWSHPEADDAVWSSGHEAVLKAPTPEVGGDLDIGLTLRPFVTSALPHQRVTAWTGQTRLAQLTLTTADLQTVHIHVPAAARTSRSEIELRLDLPDAHAPAQLTGDTPDRRVIAIKLKHIEARKAEP